MLHNDNTYPTVDSYILKPTWWNPIVFAGQMAGYGQFGIIN